MNFEDYSSLADYAKKIGVVAGNLKNWVEKAGVKPAGKFGNTNVYLVADLVKAVGENSSSASALRAVGYVHPDKYQEVVERAQRLAVAAADAISESANQADEYEAAINGFSDLLDRAEQKYNELLANFNGLQAELISTQKQYARAADELVWTRVRYEWETDSGCGDETILESAERQLEIALSE